MLELYVDMLRVGGQFTKRPHVIFILNIFAKTTMDVSATTVISNTVKWMVEIIS